MAPLTDTERSALREQLLAERVRMVRQLAALERNFEELVESAELQPPDDEHDPDATTAYDRAQVSSLATATRVRLAEVDRALAAIDGGPYGACGRCGRSIGVARLQAMPATTTCVTCAATG